MFETPIHWVRGIEPHRVGMMARPRGGEWLHEEVEAWRRADVGVVVCLLESREIRELELGAEATLCADSGIAFRHFPIPDRGVPGSQTDAERLVAELHSQLLQGKGLAIHCRAGIGRTGLIAACLLHRLGVPWDAIFPMLVRARGIAVPDTSAQSDWVRVYCSRRDA